MESGEFLGGVRVDSQRGSAELSGGQLPLAGGQTPLTHPRQIQPCIRGASVVTTCLHDYVGLSMNMPLKARGSGNYETSCGSRSKDWPCQMVSLSGTAWLQRHIACPRPLRNGAEADSNRRTINRKSDALPIAPPRHLSDKPLEMCWINLTADQPNI